MWIRTFAPLLTILLFPVSVSATDWATYTNAEYNFKVDYPVGTFVRKREAANGDGIVMETKDGMTEFRAYGFENESALPLKTIQKIVMEDGSGREITYKRIKKNWMVISGYEWEGKQKLIFYQRLAANKDTSEFSAFELIYPVSQRARFDPLIKRMSLSLTAPR